MKLFSRRPPDRWPIPEPRRRPTDWVNRLTTSGSNRLHKFSQWLLKHLRAWETRTPVSSRRRQVLLVFGFLGSLWVIRLIYLFQQPLPQSLTSPVPGLWPVTPRKPSPRPTTHSVDSAYQQSRFIYQKSKAHP